MGISFQQFSSMYVKQYLLEMWNSTAFPCRRIEVLPLLWDTYGHLCPILFLCSIIPPYHSHTKGKVSIQQPVLRENFECLLPIVFLCSIIPPYHSHTKGKVSIQLPVLRENFECLLPIVFLCSIIPPYHSHTKGKVSIQQPVLRENFEYLFPIVSLMQHNTPISFPYKRKGKYTTASPKGKLWVPSPHSFSYAA